MDFFVSYTTRDHYIDRELLKDINLILSYWGECYIDLLHNNATDKQQHVEIMLSQADLLILIASRSITQSEWVQWELTEAKNNRIPIIVVNAISDRNETLKNLKTLFPPKCYLPPRNFYLIDETPLFNPIFSLGINS
ncbi:TIR domain-containing protein [Rahnella aquatilis]|nr:TIR domain-containing protein [Rahnella aquatilis]